MRSQGCQRRASVSFTSSVGRSLIRPPPLRDNLSLPAPWPHGLAPPGVGTPVNLAAVPLPSTREVLLWTKKLFAS